MRELLVWMGDEGVTVVPLFDTKAPDLEKKVFVAGGPVETLTLTQQRLLIDLTFREHGAHLDGAVFIDGNVWCRTASEARPTRIELLRFDPRGDRR